MLNYNMNKLRNVAAFSSFQHNKIHYVDRVMEYGIDTVFRKIKNQIGAEFYANEWLVSNGKKTREFMNCTFPELFRKYKQDSDKAFIPFVDIKKIGIGTFMYIASSRFIPGRIESVMSNDKMEDVLYIYIFGKQYRKFAKIFRNAINHDKIENSNNAIYTVSTVEKSNYDIVSMNFNARHLDSLVFSNNENKIVKEHLDKFVKNSEFYKSRGITYKTGILLYGTPGTGKSSMARAIATMYNRNICQINMATIDHIDFSNLTMMINQDTDKYIVLFEDIDTLYLDRKDEKTDKDYQSIINKMLQFLDSNTSPTDVIFIATTNHIDRLDEALLRPGRFDLKLEVKGLNKDDVQKLITILDNTANVDDILRLYGEPEPDGTYNQSKIQNIVVRGKAVEDEVPVE